MTSTPKGARVTNTLTPRQRHETNTTRSHSVGRTSQLLRLRELLYENQPQHQSVPAQPSRQRRAAAISDPPGGGDALRVVVGQHALPHRRRQERHAARLHQTADLGLRPAVRRAWGEGDGGGVRGVKNGTPLDSTRRRTSVSARPYAAPAGGGGGGSGSEGVRCEASRSEVRDSISVVSTR